MNLGMKNGNLAVRHTAGGWTCGFTLIELLLVIGVISVLVSIALPALSQARGTVEVVRTLSAARAKGFAHALYMTDHKGAAIAEQGAFGVPVLDVGGVPAESMARGRWPLQLGTYAGLEFFRGAIYCGKDLEERMSNDTPMAGYMRSLAPSFGLNSDGVGGRNYTSSGFRPAPARRPEVDAESPSTLMHFGRARLYPAMLNVTSGYFYIRAPADGGAIWPENESYSPTSIASPGMQTWGGLDFGFLGERTVVGYCDGRADTPTLQDMRDMRRWHNQAYVMHNPDLTW